MQSLLAEIFFEQGYYSGSELDLRISPDFKSRADFSLNSDEASHGIDQPGGIVSHTIFEDVLDFFHSSHVLRRVAVHDH